MNNVRRLKMKSEILKMSYSKPVIAESVLELEYGIAVGSGTALPKNDNQPVSETWDNVDITTDTPIFW